MGPLLPPDRGSHGEELRRSLTVAGLTGLGYLLGALVAWRFLDAQATPVFYAPAGVSVAALLLSPRRRWPWILAAVGLVELAVDTGHGQSVAVALGFVLANTAEPLVGALVVRRAVALPDLSQRRDAAVFLLGGVVLGPLVGAAVGSAVIGRGLGRSWLEELPSYWIGDALGVLTVGSAILVWGAPSPGPASGEDAGRRRLGVAGLLTAACVGLTALGLATRAPFVLPLSGLLVAAALGGVAALSAGAVGVAFTANVLTARQIGPWGDAAAGDGLAGLQALLAVGMLGPWALAVEVAERRRVRASLVASATTQERLQRMGEVRAALDRAFTLDEIGRAVAEEALPAIGYDGMVGILTGDQGPMRVWATRAERARQPVEVPVVSAHPLGRGYRLGSTAVLEGWAVAPLPSAEGPLGALALRVPPGRPAGAMTQDVRTLADAVAPHVARGRLHERDQEVARQLQQALLPEVSPTPVPGTRVAVGYRPADPRHEVGGDWYDAFELPGGRLAVAVGDVVGHDLVAATTMGRLQQALRLLARQGSEPGEVLASLDLSSEELDGALLATVGLAVYDPARRTLDHARAGHLPPLLVDGSGARYLTAGLGPPLGLRPAPGRESAQELVPDPALLVWYTDGLVERRGESLERGLERLRRLAHRVGPGVPPDRMRERLLAGSGTGVPLLDDTVVICVGL